MADHIIIMELNQFLPYVTKYLMDWELTSNPHFMNFMKDPSLVSIEEYAD